MKYCFKILCKIFPFSVLLFALDPSLKFIASDLPVHVPPKPNPPPTQHQSWRNSHFPVWEHSHLRSESRGAFAHRGVPAGTRGGRQQSPRRESVSVAVVSGMCQGGAETSTLSFDVGVWVVATHDMRQRGSSTGRGLIK